MTAPVPREKKIPAGLINFINNSYGADVFGPNGGLPLADYEEMWLDLTGTLTIAGGTTDGTPVFENPRTLIKSVEVKVTGSPLSDSFVELPLTDLVQFNIIENRPLPPPQETPVLSGAIGVYTFRGIYRLPFAANDMANPYKFFFPSGRYAQTNIRIKFGTAEDLVAGGDRTKTISACSVQLWGREYSFDPDFELATDLLFHQRVAIKTVAIAAAQTDFDNEITRTAAFLRGILIKQYQTDANGVETPVDTILRATDPIVLMLNDQDRKYEYDRFTLEQRARDYYLQPLGFGYTFLDMSPRGDENILRKMNMLNFQTIKVRVNNANPVVAGQTNNLRFTLLKYAFAA